MLRRRSGAGLRPAAELPLGAELYASAGSAGDLVAGSPENRVVPIPPSCLQWYGNRR